jgi:ribose-phosphate pyrophosphokinase
MRNAKVFAGSSHTELAALIVQKLGIPAAPITIKNHANRETSIELDVSVRNQDIFIIQSGSDTINDHLMELLILINSCRTSSAARITAIIPYFPYSKQSKKKKSRGAITAKLIANMIIVAGADHIITMDLHHDQIQGFFSKPVDNLLSEPCLCKYILDHITPYHEVSEVVIVSKNPGGVKRVTNIADRLRCDFALIHQDKNFPSPVRSQNRRRRLSELHRSSNPQIAGGASQEGMILSESHSITDVSVSTIGPVKLKESMMPDEEAIEIHDALQLVEVIEKEWHKDGLQLVGDVNGRVCVIIDDIVDKAASFLSAAELLIAKGASRVYVMGTHGILSGDALAEFEECTAIHEVRGDFRYLSCWDSPFCQ